MEKQFEDWDDSVRDPSEGWKSRKEDGYISISISNYKEILEVLSDSQELKLFEYSHQGGGGGFVGKITAGELGKQLTLGGKGRFVDITFADGRKMTWDNNDYYDIQKITPEIKISDEKKEKVLQEVQKLNEVGVPSGLFLRYHENQTETEIVFTPEDIIRFAKIIEEYNKNK